MSGQKVGTNSFTFVWTLEGLRGFEWSYDYGTRLNKVLVYENLLKCFWWFVMTQRPFEHEWSKSWNQLLDLRFDPRRSKRLRMVL